MTKSINIVENLSDRAVKFEGDLFAYFYLSIESASERWVVNHRDVILLSEPPDPQREEICSLRDDHRRYVFVFIKA